MRTAPGRSAGGREAGSPTSSSATSRRSNSSRSATEPSPPATSVTTSSAAGQVEGGHAHLPVGLDEGDQAGHPGRLQEIGVDRGARAQHAGDLAPDQPAGHDLAHLVPEDHPMTGVEQAAQVGRDRLVGHSAHGQPAGAAEAAAGEGDLQDRRGQLGVGAEELVEVAEPGQDEGVRMLGLDGAVLAEDGGVAGVVEVDGAGRARAGSRRAGAGASRALGPSPHHRRSGRGGLDVRAELPGAGGADPPPRTSSPAAARPRRQEGDLPLAGAPEGPAVRRSTLSTRTSTRSADQGLVALQGDLALEVEEMIEPPLLLLERDVVGAPGRGGAGPDRVGLEVDDVEAHRARAGASVPRNSASVSPEKPTMMSVVSPSSGTVRPGAPGSWPGTRRRCRGGASGGAARRHRPGPAGGAARRRWGGRASPRRARGPRCAGGR